MARPREVAGATGTAAATCDLLLPARTDQAGKLAGEPVVVATSTPILGSSPSTYGTFARLTEQRLLVAYDRAVPDSQAPGVARVFSRMVDHATVRRRAIRH